MKAGKDRAALSQPAAQQGGRKPLTDEQCEQAIRLAGLWELAAAVPTNKALLIGLCRAAHGIGGKHE